MASVLMVIGLLLWIVGYILVLNQAFKTSIGWGLGSLFIPFVVFIFVAKNWQETRRGFQCWIGGFAMVIVAVMIAPSRPSIDAPVQTASEEAEPAQARALSVPATAPAPAPVQQTTAPARVATTPAPAEAEEPKRKLEQVYLDRSSGQYYLEDCKKRPADATRMSKSVAVMQGFTQAPCQ